MYVYALIIYFMKLFIETKKKNCQINHFFIFL